MPARFNPSGMTVEDIHGRDVRLDVLEGKKPKSE